MRINIRVTGAAGLGMNSTADIIADVFAELGYHDCPSFKRWGE